MTADPRGAGRPKHAHRKDKGTLMQQIFSSNENSAGAKVAG
jgi:hypothetical protein